MVTNNVLIQKYQGATSGYNQINPLTVDEDLNTRIGFDSGSTSKDIIDYNSQFWWKRRTKIISYYVKQNYISAEDTANECYLCFGSATDSIVLEYSNNYQVNQNGEISLVNPESVSVNLKSAYQNNSEFMQFSRKYVRQKKFQTQQRIIYVPSDVSGCAVQWSSVRYNTGYALWAYKNGSKTGVYEIIPQEEETTGSWGKISSDNIDTYPLIGNQNQADYLFLGNPLKDFADMAKIDAGTYIGTRSSEITLTFDFQPKLVFITVKSGGNSLNGSSLFAVWGTSEISSFYRPVVTGGSLSSSTSVYFTWGDKSFHAANVSGLNVNGTEYYYVAFG